MDWLKDFYNAFVASSTHNAISVRKAETELVEVTRMRKWANNASAYHRCRIGRVTIKAPK